MSMPKVELCFIHRGNAINNMIASLALVEAGLAHILNAEGEKLQKALEIPGLTVCQLIGLNHSVAEVVAGAASLEAAMQDKVGDIIKLLSETNG